MKNIIILIVIIISMLFPSCGSAPNTDSGSTETNTKTIESTELPGTSSKVDSSTPSVTIAQTPQDEELVFNTKTETVNYSPKKIEADKLAYTSYNVRGALEWQNDIQNIILYSGDRVYYEYVDISSSDSDGVTTVFSYDFTTQEVKELFSYDFSIYEPVYVELNNCLFVAPCKYDSQGKLLMSILCYDFSEEQLTALNELYVTSPSVDIEALGNNEVLIFVYKESNNGSADIVYRYNTDTCELSEYYEDYTDDWDDLTLTSKNVFNVRTSGSSVYMIKYQGINGKMVYTLEIHDTFGNLIKEYDLNVFDSLMENDVRIKEISVEDAWCINDYLLFKMYYTGKYSTDGGTWEYRLCKIIGDSVVDLELDEYKLENADTVSCRLNTREYMILGSDRDDIDMIVIDTFDNTLIPIVFSVEEDIANFPPYYITCNECGQILVIGEDADHKNKYLYTVGVDDLLKSVK